MDGKKLSKNERMQKILQGAEPCEECNYLEVEVGALEDVPVHLADGTETIRRLCPNCRKGLGTQKANTA